MQRVDKRATKIFLIESAERLLLAHIATVLLLLHATRLRHLIPLAQRVNGGHHLRKLRDVGAARAAALLEGLQLLINDGLPRLVRRLDIIVADQRNERGAALEHDPRKRLVVLFLRSSIRPVALLDDVISSPAARNIAFIRMLQSGKSSTLSSLGTTVSLEIVSPEATIASSLLRHSCATQATRRTPRRRYTLSHV